jgi:hypothetical protein
VDFSLGHSFSADFRRTSIFFSVFGIIGEVAIALAVTSRLELATSLIWSFSCLLAGALIGFLFAIPKISQVQSTDNRSYTQQVNTNLEQISDWLTKIIVGVGLIQLTKLPAFLDNLARLLTAGVGRDPDNKAFALAVIVYFTILGFLFGYVATRLFLAGAFSRADQVATTAIEEIKAIARDLSPELLKQVLLTATPEALIKGEESLTEEESKDNATKETVESQSHAVEVTELNRVLEELSARRR